jgi:hypothetical protein
MRGVIPYPPNTPSRYGGFINLKYKIVLGYKLEVACHNTQVAFPHLSRENIYQPVLNLHLVVINSLYSPRMSCRYQRLLFNRFATVQPFHLQLKQAVCLLMHIIYVCLGIITFLGTEPVRKRIRIIKRSVFPNGDKAASSSDAIDGKTRIYLSVHLHLFNHIWRNRKAVTTRLENEAEYTGVMNTVLKLHCRCVLRRPL